MKTFNFLLHLYVFAIYKYEKLQLKNCNIFRFFNLQIWQYATFTNHQCFFWFRNKIIWDFYYSYVLFSFGNMKICNNYFTFMLLLFRNMKNCNCTIHLRFLNVKIWKYANFTKHLCFCNSKVYATITTNLGS